MIEPGTGFPTCMNPNDKLILFDGVCKLCNAWSRFIIRHDKKRAFKLASVQSVEGQKVLAHFDMPLDRFDTMLYVNAGQAHKKSSAFIGIMTDMGYPWRLFTLFRIIPRSLRDWLYDRIALNRYRLFGKYDHCLLPTPDHEERFL